MRESCAPPIPPGARYLTVGQASRLLQLHVQSVYKMVARGEIHAVRLGRSLRIDLEGLEAGSASTAATGRSSRSAGCGGCKGKR